MVRQCFLLHRKFLVRRKLSTGAKSDRQQQKARLSPRRVVFRREGMKHKKQLAELEEPGKSESFLIILRL